MMKLKLHTIEEYLKKIGYQPQIQETTGQLYVVLNVERREFPLFFKTDGSVLQLLIFMPCAVESSAFPDLARLLHLLNKEIDIPGFGMDEQGGVVFYRCVLPTLKGELEEELLKTIVKAMERVASLFFPIVANIASGTPYDSISDRIRDSLRRFAAENVKR